MSLFSKFTSLFTRGERAVVDWNDLEQTLIGADLGPALAQRVSTRLHDAYACYTNADRNLISDNIFATILEKRHPKEHETFEIPEQTIIIKGNFNHFKTNEPKSSSYHKLVQSQCGDDNVQSGNGQNIIRVDPCLKLFVGCPIMVSVNDFKKNGVVKETTRKFKGLVLLCFCFIVSVVLV